jgi:hypothetical protein
MRRWLAVLLTTLTGAVLAQVPPLSLTAVQLRFDPASLPQAMAAYRLWLASGRGVALSDAAMAMVAPGISLNAANHAQYAPRIHPMNAAVGKRLADGNADKAESEADAARRLGAMLAATEWQALIEGARPANAAAQSYVDATLAIAMLTSAGIGEQTSPDASRLWARVRGMASAYDPAAGKGRLQPAASTAEAAFDKLKSAVEQTVRAQRARSAAAALALARELYPDYASGKARQIGSAAKIEALIEALRMPELARFYGALWADIHALEVQLRVHELARAAGRPENWDSDGTRRPRMTEFILPRVQKLGADAPTSDALAGMLTELISDVDADWMRVEAASARGQKLMPTVERLIIASFWRRGIEPARAWAGNAYRAGDIAQDAINALRGDPNGRDAVMKRLEPLEQKSQPVYERWLNYQVSRTRAAVQQVMQRDTKEIRALLDSLK